MTRDQMIATDSDPEPRTFRDAFRDEALASRVTLGQLYRERADDRAEIVALKRQLVAAGVRVTS